LTPAEATATDQGYISATDMTDSHPVDDSMRHHGAGHHGNAGINQIYITANSINASDSSWHFLDHLVISHIPSLPERPPRA